MTSLARVPIALSLAAILSSLILPSTRAIVVDDFGVRLGEPAHISLSTGFNGVVSAGIKHLVVGGQTMDGFCIDPFTRAFSSSQGYSFVPLTQAPEAPWTLNSTKAVEIKDLWAMFYSPNMSQKNAAGLQLAIWEIVGGSSFQVIGKDYHASEMLAALHSYTGPGANLIALTGPGQDYVVQTPPLHSTPTPTPHSTPAPTPASTPTPTPRPNPPTSTPPPTPTPSPICTRPPGSGSPPPHFTPPPRNVPDSGATLPLFAVPVLILLAINSFGVPALERARRTQGKVSSSDP